MDVLQILNKIGYTDLQDFGKEYRTRPLYRASDNRTSLCIKKATGEWFDFSERTGGHIAQLVQKTLQLSTLDQVKEVIQTEISLPSKNNNYELSDVKRFDKNLLGRLIQDHKYWENRGISEYTIKQFGGGITFNGRMTNRYVFPIFDERDDLVGFSGRLLKDNPDYPKWKHLGAKSNWCYPIKLNADKFVKYREVILVESIGDMLALWENGIYNSIVTFGVDISAKIIQFLLRLDAKKIVIAFNNDEGNNLVGNIAALDGYKKLTSFFDEKQIELGVPEKKDFGTMTGEDIEVWRTKHQIHKN